MTTPDPVLAVRGLSLTRSRQLLFSQLQLTLTRGDALLVTGPNGAGKSSLLRVLAGLSTADQGSCTWWPQRPDNDPPPLLYIGHRLGLSPEQTALQNLRHLLALRAYAGDDESCVAMLARVGLAGAQSTPVKQLSAGQQRRVALAQLWLAPPPVWILDEPFTALDKQAVAGLQQRFVDHLQQGGVLILTTHQPLSEPLPSQQTLSLGGHS